MLSGSTGSAVYLYRQGDFIFSPTGLPGARLQIERGVGGGPLTWPQSSDGRL
jgi:hypothetical protein